MSAAVAVTGPTFSPADRLMRRLLRVEHAQRKCALIEARSAFTGSIILTGIRCALTYLVIPIAGPTVGIVGSGGHLLGAIVSVAALLTSTTSMRKFWIANHKYRWHYTAFAAVIITYMIVSLGSELFYWL